MVKRSSLLSLLLVLFLSSCSRMKTTVPISTTEISPLSPYPGPGSPASTITLPYPMPTMETETVLDVPFVVPTPSNEAGVVTGQLMNDKTKQPLQGQSIYLGQKYFLTPGPAYTIGVQEKSSPHTMSDKEVRFAIGNVPPGKYVVMVWTPWKTSLVIDPKTSQELDVIVQAGQTVDIGQMEAADPFSK